ncbi:hypothetical protein PT015_12510 [Candidatus Mycobacterium wuenschmannii]|uniref:Uncharacterized protein n=1 Tax=Candidatus Mycobacterium wuenschmannii TaxID=3027808 RepID=A0ABY8VWA3_9MYCO|nr:hypothetical protein [Candidatus Mycobacterium wuenschmannii]WIM85779.1 hypothetical protein PT015_12510 [Candidatus Mycobacterium wuenschmannii]
MTAAASTLKPLHCPTSGSSSRREVREGPGRYQFQVVAPSVADAVMSIGGLIFDRAMAGWDVGVVIDGDTERTVDDRPLRILGAHVAKRLSDPNYARALPRPHQLAVAADVLVRSDSVCRHVLEMGSVDETEVLLWGRHHPTNLSRTFVAARHQPSAAAHIFKAQALAAGGAQAIGRADEAFYSMA